WVSTQGSGPSDTSLQGMVRVVGGSFQIEEVIEAAKGEVGLENSEVRLWTRMVSPYHAFHAGSCLSHRGPIPQRAIHSNRSVGDGIGSASAHRRRSTPRG